MKLKSIMDFDLLILSQFIHFLCHKDVFLRLSIIIP